MRKININKVSIYISFHTDYEKKNVKTQDGLLDYFLNQIHFDREIGYAGFSTKKSLREKLKFLIFGKNYHKKQKLKILPLRFKNAEVLSEIRFAIRRCFQELSAKSLWIFLFPTFDPFVRQRMGGIGGFTPWKNTILLTLHPGVKNWKKQLRTTLVHEFNHSIRFCYFPLSPARTLLDAIISEGLADNFSHQIIGGKLNPWAAALPLRDCQKIFQVIKKLLNSKSRKVYSSLFFEDKKYPLWAGYSLGYQIVKSFREKNPKLSWQKIMKMNSDEILKKSGWV